MIITIAESDCTCRENSIYINTHGRGEASPEKATPDDERNGGKAEGVIIIEKREREREREKRDLIRFTLPRYAA